MLRGVLALIGWALGREMALAAEMHRADTGLGRVPLGVEAMGQLGGER